jgi:hydrogenase maturation protease
MSKEIIVLGLGNPLMSDEGIGTFLVEQLQKQAHKFPKVEFVDAGTGGMNLLHWLSGRRKAIIIDCARMKTPPGTMIQFTPDQVESVKRLSHRSLHEADILKIIDLAKALNECPDEIIIFGIEPETIQPAQNLSETLARKVPDYLEKITQLLCDWLRPA